MRPSLPGASLASRDPSPSAAAAAALRGRGRVHIAGWSLGGRGPDRDLQGEEEGGGVRGGPGEARTMLLLLIISARPSKLINSLLCLWCVPPSRYTWSLAPILLKKNFGPESSLAGRGCSVPAPPWASDSSLEHLRNFQPFPNVGSSRSGSATGRMATCSLEVQDRQDGGAAHSNYYTNVVGCG